MKCKHVQSQIPEFLAGELGRDDQQSIERHLADCASCAEEYERLAAVWNGLDGIPDEEPHPRVSERFHAMLDGFREAGMPAAQDAPPDVGPRKREMDILFQVYIPRLAAAIILVVAGFMAGRMDRSEPEIAQLHQEMSDLRNLVATSLVNQESAIKRLEGLAMASRVTDPDEMFLSLLVDTINTDPDVNVRLAAVDAITTFASEDDWLRSELVQTLAMQTSPLVQVSLIELLVDLREDRALGVLRALADNEDALDAVRNRARWGLQQMI